MQAKFLICLQIAGSISYLAQNDTGKILLPRNHIDLAAIMHYLYALMKFDSPLKKTLLLLVVASAWLLVAYFFTAGSSGT